jgi:endonuclease III
MKTATKHADALKSLVKRLYKSYDPQPRPVYDPLHALVRGVFSYDLPDSRADDLMKVIETQFVDLNEVRVATELELAEIIGPRVPDIDRRCSMAVSAMMHIFERENILSLNRLKEMGKREARQFLRDLPGLHPFAEAFTMLLALDGHAFPLDDKMLQRLREEAVVEEGETLETAQRFVEHYLKADELYDVYSVLRQAAHDTARKRRK